VSEGSGKRMRERASASRRRSYPSRRLLASNLGPWTLDVKHSAFRNPHSDGTLNVAPCTVGSFRIRHFAFRIQVVPSYAFTLII
jgi:hypothetical protein